CAFHSPLVAPAMARLADLLAETSLSAPRVPVFSNTTAARYPDAPEAIAALLAQHLVEPVEFEREIVAMHDDGARLFVEAGPKGGRKSVLSGLVGRIVADRPHVAVPVDRPERSGVVPLLDCLATLAAEGAAIEADRLFVGRDVRPLDLSNLGEGGHAAAPRASAWLVNGGRARPVGVEPEESKPIELEDVMNDCSVNAQTPVAYGSHEAEPHAVETARATPVPPAPITATDGDGDVMRQSHGVMARFLEPERAVMLTYLGRPDLAPATSAPPRPIESITVPRSIPAPLSPAANGSNGHDVPIAAPAADGNGHAAT